MLSKYWLGKFNLMKLLIIIIMKLLIMIRICWDVLKSLNWKLLPNRNAHKDVLYLNLMPIMKK